MYSITAELGKEKYPAKNILKYIIPTPLINTPLCIYLYMHTYNTQYLCVHIYI